MRRPNLHLHLHHKLSGLLPHHLTRPVKELFGSVALLGFASAAVGIFEPIYLFTLGYNVPHILFYYFLLYFLYFFLIPLGGKFALRFGFERGIILGSGLLILYYLALIGVAGMPWLFFIAPVLSALQRTFYWTGYHGDFAQGATEGEIGREIGEAHMVITLVTVLGPIAGGAIITAWGFPALFLIVAGLVLLSNVPLLSSREAVTPRPFSYSDAYRRLLEPARRRRLLAFVGYGEDLLFFALMPIFAFLVVGAALNVGIIVTLSALCTGFFLLYIGKLTDVRDTARLLWAGIAVKVVSWLSRFFVFSSFGLFLTDTLYRLGSGSTEFPLVTGEYERAKKDGVMENVVFFEMSLILGRHLGVLALLALLAFGVELWTAVFTAGAALSLLFGLYPIRARQRDAHG